MLGRGTAAGRALLRCPSRTCRSPVWHGLSRFRILATTPSVSQAPSPAGPVQVATPLCRRPAIHQAPVADLLAWRDDVSNKITHDIRDSFEALDQGPGAQELLREVGWVLEDVVAEVRHGDTLPWDLCSWQQLSQDVKAAVYSRRDTSSWQVKLRASVQQLRDLWDQRLQHRVPFQYLTNTAHWHTYILAVGPGVLIPRPETEIFPELVKQALARRPHLAALPWVDLGTGSGAIAIATADVLRLHNKEARVLAVDLSPVAAAYAQANIVSTGMAEHVTVLQGSWLEPVRQHLQDSAGQLCGHSTPAGSETGTARQQWGAPQVGAVLSNPPYIPRSTMEAGLQAEVGQHEPWSALDGGLGPGLDSLQVICEGAAAALTPGGFLALETEGGPQASLVASILATMTAEDGAAVFSSIQVLKDCYGVERFVTADRADRGCTGGQGRV